MGWRKSAIDEGFTGKVARLLEGLSETIQVTSKTMFGRFLLIMTGLSILAVWSYLMGSDSVSAFLRVTVFVVVIVFGLYLRALRLPLDDKVTQWLTGMFWFLFQVFLFGIGLFPIFVIGTIALLVFLYLHVTSGFPGLYEIKEAEERMKGVYFSGHHTGVSLDWHFYLSEFNKNTGPKRDSRDLLSGSRKEENTIAASSTGPVTEVATSGSVQQNYADTYHLETDNFGYVIGLIRFIAREVGPITVNITAPDGTSVSLPAGRQAVNWVRTKADEGLWYVSFSLPPAYSHLAEVLRDVYGVEW